MSTKTVPTVYQSSKTVKKTVEYTKPTDSTASISRAVEGDQIIELYSTIGCTYKPRKHA